MALPYVFGTQTSPIPLSYLDANFNTPATLGNTAVILGGTTSSVGNLTLTNVTIGSVASPFPNNYLANSNVTIGSSTVNLGGTLTSISNVTLSNVTINTVAANGQVSIGNGTGTVLNTLTAGSGISIVNGPGSITISSSGAGGALPASGSLVLTSASSSSQTMTPTIYGQTLTLPDATTVSKGALLYNVSNGGTYAVKILDYYGNILGFIFPFTSCIFGLSDQTTKAGVWTISNNEHLSVIASLPVNLLSANYSILYRQQLDSSRILIIAGSTTPATNPYGVVYNTATQTWGTPVTLSGYSGQGINSPFSNQLTLLPNGNVIMFSTDAVPDTNIYVTNIVISGTTISSSNATLATSATNITTMWGAITVGNTAIVMYQNTAGYTFRAAIASGASSPTVGSEFLGTSATQQLYPYTSSVFFGVTNSGIITTYTVISTSLGTGTTLTPTGAGSPTGKVMPMSNNLTQLCALSGAYALNITSTSGAFSIPFSYSGSAALQVGMPVYLYGIPTGLTLSGVAITGTAGQFSCTATSQTLLVGMSITVSGTLSGSGSITGYSNPTTYYIIATNGSSTFTLSTTSGGSAITTTAGTTTGLSFLVNAGSITGYTASGATNQYPQTYYIIATNGTNQFTLSATPGGSAVTTTIGVMFGINIIVNVKYLCVYKGGTGTTAEASLFYINGTTPTNYAVTVASGALVSCDVVLSQSTNKAIICYRTTSYGTNILTDASPFAGSSALSIGTALSVATNPLYAVGVLYNNVSAYANAAVFYSGNGRCAISYSGTSPTILSTDFISGNFNSTNFSKPTGSQNNGNDYIYVNTRDPSAFFGNLNFSANLTTTIARVGVFSSGQSYGYVPKFGGFISGSLGNLTVNGFFPNQVISSTAITEIQIVECIT